MKIRTRRRQKPAGALNLPRFNWEGGSGWWAQFAKAKACGWNTPGFFPVAVFLGKNDATHAAALIALGCNTYMAVDHAGSTDITDTTNTGMYCMLQPSNPYLTPAETNWSSAEAGSNTRVVGWFLCDEPDQGYGGYIGTDDENGYLAAVQALAATVEAFADGRFKYCNFGNGIVNTFWSPNTMDDMVREVDGCSVDKYPYTDDGVSRAVYRGSSDWAADGGTTTNIQTSAPYGWNAKRFFEYWNAASDRKPYWGFIETKMPYLHAANDPRSIITYAQIEGAVWSAIANEARGVAYFQYNGFYDGADAATAPTTDPNTGIAPDIDTYSLVECEVGLQTAVAAIHSKIRSLATVLNTQTCLWDTGASGIVSMMKKYQGNAYIFASLAVAGTTGSKTFTLPRNVRGRMITVVSENRTLPVVGRSFTDTFANEYTHHVYKVAI